MKDFSSACLKKSSKINILLILKPLCQKSSSFKRFLLVALLLLKIFSHDLEASETLFLKERFEKAENGDYIVALHDKTYSLLHIHSKSQNAIIIEEISVPQHEIKAKNKDWKKWLSENAKGHSSWIFYELSLPGMKLNDAFSFSSNGWLEQEHPLFETLFSLPFEKVSDRDRKKIGPAPTGDSLDFRKIWHPPLIKKGQIIKAALFDAWKCTWPKDGSDLSGKLIEIYLSKDTRIDYYPFWLQVSNAFAKAKIRVVDSGHELKSPKTFFPRRPPILLSQGSFENGEFIVHLSGPAYYKNYQIWAIDDTNGKSIELDADIEYQKEGKRSLRVTKRELVKKLKAEAFYRFMIASLDYPSAWTESQKALRLPKSFQNTGDR